MQEDEMPDGENPLIKTVIKLILEEREIPEILHYQKDIVESLDTLIKGQEDAISSIEPSSTNENFFTMIYKTEIERLKFLLKMYLRTRLFKIQKYYLFLISKEQGELLSEHEYEFVAQYFIHK